MKKIVAAIALTIALPAMAHAQAALAPKAEQAQTCPMDHMKMAGMDHSKMASMDHFKMMGMDHSKMDMAGMKCPVGEQSGTETQLPDPHSNHQR